MEYFCVRIDVDRFVLLATTGKNAKKQSPFSAAARQTDFFTRRNINSKTFKLKNKKNDELFIYLRIGVRRTPR